MSAPNQDRAFLEHVDRELLGAGRPEPLWSLEPLTTLLARHVALGPDGRPLPPTRGQGQEVLRLRPDSPLGITELRRLEHERTLYPDSTGALRLTFWRDPGSRYFLRVSGGCVAYQDRLFGPFVPHDGGFTGPPPRSPAPPATPAQATGHGAARPGALSLAILSKDLAAARRLLRERPGEVHRLDGNGMSALHYALSAPHAEAVRLLLEHGADPNLASSHGLSPLMITVARRNTELTRLLLERGADPNEHERVQPARSSLLQLAEGLGDAKLVQLLRRHGAR
jgi:hypothetical protein